MNTEDEMLINIRIQQSEAALREVEFLLEHKMLSLATNRIYYSIFYAISAISIKDNYSTSKHTRLLGWFNKNYINSGMLPKEFGKMIYACFENREKSDYDFLFELTKEEINGYYELAKKFISAVKEMIKVKFF
ncbi:MAG: HEPN domain-containing protein [Bacteroidetes bacterium]|nr:HEPN domain-containing protein [Bacteroidota bacterium]